MLFYFLKSTTFDYISVIAGGNLTDVEISLDGGAFNPVTGLSSWIYKLPTGGNTWRDNTQHIITARATDATGASSQVSITVRKGHNKDVNGDGYADLAVSAQRYPGSADYGRIYVFYSSGSSGIDATQAATAATKITGETAGDFLAYFLALGDVNGDGYADLAAGSPSYNSSTGRVFIFHSTGSGGITDSAPSAANSIIVGEGANSGSAYRWVI